MATPSACAGVVISGSATRGGDPVPLYEAGKSEISCVIELEALGQIQVSKASITGIIGSGGTTSYGGVSIINGVQKFNITAQSGQAYFVDTLTVIGKSS